MDGSKKQKQDEQDMYEIMNTKSPQEMLLVQTNQRGLIKRNKERNITGHK